MDLLLSWSLPCQLQGSSLYGVEILYKAWKFLPFYLEIAQPEIQDPEHSFCQDKAKGGILVMVHSLPWGLCPFPTICSKGWPCSMTEGMVTHCLSGKDWDFPLSWKQTVKQIKVAWNMVFGRKGITSHSLAFSHAWLYCQSTCKWIIGSPEILFVGLAQGQVTFSAQIPMINPKTSWHLFISGLRLLN